MDFCQPNIEISQKMANGRLLFLALGYIVVTIFRFTKYIAVEHRRLVPKTMQL